MLIKLVAHRRFRIVRSFCLTILAWPLFGSPLTPTADAAWSVISLHPLGATSSRANGIRSGKQVGVVDGNAVTWTGTPLSMVNLGPNFAGNTDGVQQVGTRSGTAALWTGTAGSYVSLHPTQVPNILASVATGVFAGLQCGYIYFQRSTVLWHAGIWTDDASTWTDLNPPGGAFTVSIAEGTHNGQQVGVSWIEGQPAAHACVWYNSAASHVDINPAGADTSYGYGVFNGRQVGWARLTGQTYNRASRWNSTAASWTDLHPLIASASEAYAEYLGQQSGKVVINGEDRASYWNGTAASWHNLHSALPPGYTSSSGVGIWISNQGVTYVTGYAVNTLTGQTEAIMWSNPVPNARCPGNANGDGVTNIDDLVAVITNWGPCPLPCPPACIGDVTLNCVVNIDDLVQVITNWGPCP